mgnify:FL=1
MYALPLTIDPKGRGRPSDYTPELFDRILGELVKGRSLNAICRDDEGTPDASVFYSWLRAHPELREAYEWARELQAHAIADLAVDMANRAPCAVGKDDVPGESLRFAAIKWASGVIAPKHYGAKSSQDVKVEGADGAGAAVFVMRLAGDGQS